MLKSIRQKRIEDDNNKKFAQINYNILIKSDRELPNFDNNNYWGDVSENSSWTTNGKRGVSLPTPYYNGYKVSDEYTEPIAPLLEYIGLMKAATIQMNALGVIGSSAAATAMGTVIGKLMANKKFQELMYKSFTEGTFEYWDTMWEIFVGTIMQEAKLAGLLTGAVSAIMLWFLLMGMLAGNTYTEVYDAWNTFEQDSITAQNKVDTEGYYDADGNWHWKWSGYTVKYDISYGNTTTTVGSKMRLFKNRHLVRGRYKSNTFGNNYFIYTFEYTKTITYIPA